MIHIHCIKWRNDGVLNTAELEAGYENTDRMRNCIMITLISIVIITICFELGCGW